MFARVKKLTALALCAALLYIPCSAALIEPEWDTPVGTPLGPVYSTDIVAYVDGAPIRSYNIDGKTAIVLEDLREYGFDVEWDPIRWELRAVATQRPAAYPVYTPPADTSGREAGTVYHTDIRTYFNGHVIRAYNIGGETAAAIEELGDMELRDFDRKPHDAFSMLLVNYVWDPTARTISMDALHPGDSMAVDYGRFTLDAFDTHQDVRGGYYYGAEGCSYKGRTILGMEIYLNVIDDSDPEQTGDWRYSANRFYPAQTLLNALGLTAVADGQRLILEGDIAPVYQDFEVSGTTYKTCYNTLTPTDVTLVRGGEEIPFDGTAALLYQGRLMLSARYVAQALGVQWKEIGSWHWGFTA